MKVASPGNVPSIQVVIYGPPGCGKSYAAAQMVRGLAAAGFDVEIADDGGSTPGSIHQGNDKDPPGTCLKRVAILTTNERVTVGEHD